MALERRIEALEAIKRAAEVLALSRDPQGRNELHARLEDEGMARIREDPYRYGRAVAGVLAELGAEKRKAALAAINAPWHGPEPEFPALERLLAMRRIQVIERNPQHYGHEVGRNLLELDRAQQKQCWEVMLEYLEGRRA